MEHVYNATLDVIKNFKLPPQDADNVLHKVTKNGEICFDSGTREYVVFDETYANEVGRTPYGKVAAAMLDAYVKILEEG